MYKENNMVDVSLNVKRKEIIDRLTSIRSEYDRCTDVKSGIAYNGSEWSISDLLRHTRGSYRGMAAKILDEEQPDLNPNGYDSDESWSRERNALLDEIESYIKMATDLTDDQLPRTGIFSGNTITILDMLERVAGHYDEHLLQLRDEVRVREGLS
jgi:hypothetical protein